MKKIFLISLLLVMATVTTSQAVVIYWATDGYGGLENVSSAVLVYITNGGIPQYGNPASINSATELGTRVSGWPIQSGGVSEQSSTYTGTVGGGNYYVVLFNNDLSKFAYSSALADNNTTWGAFETEFSPATGVFIASGFTTVPEPSVATLLLVGVAAAVLRRRKRA